ncbi:phosphate ABC transporter permease PstA [Desnuesiella massiliensis]|uniref:phosphate ABC transporter permease PstA n=1 Tax=Desnuesiella massiliensis TaxID=1650662 RepID=UPI0006E13045|nr:phosphate ABC transporter permease PstA [Desnuesiella massiliensis]
MDQSTLRNIKRRKIKNSIVKYLFLICTLFGIVVLIVLLKQILETGLKHLDLKFLTSFPSRTASKAGIKSALVGSLWVILLTGLFSFPLGVGTAIYLEEYAKKNWFNKLLQINISNLAGIPSIVYGMLGLSVFVKGLRFGTSILSGSLTLTLLILPVIIISSQEAIKSVPDTLRQGSLALGVTKWQTITGVVLPYSLPGILTGCILAISRALGEAAPLIMVGAVGYIAFLPKGLLDSFTALPIQIYNWTSRPQAEFQEIAAAGIIVLMAVLLTFNAIAVVVRNKYQKRFD